jgi:hypothetical protein
MRTDNIKLAELIEECFFRSMDGAVPPGDRKEWAALGRRLRGCYLNLVSKNFSDGDPEIIKANKMIANLNKKINAKDGVSKVVNFIKEIDELTGRLDRILKLVVPIS